MKKMALKGYEVPPIRLEPLPGSSKWLTEVSLLKEKVRKGQRVTSRGIDKNGLVNPLLTREKKEKDESEQLDTNNERVKYRQALVDIISKDEENTTSISHNQINTIRYYYYIHHGISCDHVAQIEPVWFDRMFKLVPGQLKSKEYGDTIELLKDEIFQDYLISSKQAIVDFVLKK